MDLSIASLISVALGIGLAAATGLRVFLPLLAVAVAARTGVIPLAEGFAWLDSTAAIVMLGTATVLEILAYYIPGVDHVLDLVASPATLVAGTVASASVMADVPPAILWPVAIIAGGGIAGLTKGTTAAVRAKTGIATAGLGNPVIATAETVGATTLSIMAIVLPVLCLIAVIALLYWIGRKAGRLVFRAFRREPTTPDPSP
jgi:hypothetical protein